MTMGSTSDSASNNMKFPPLRLAELMPNLMALKNLSHSPDTSYTSGEESECSLMASPAPRVAPLPLQQDSFRTPSGRTISAATAADSHRKLAENKENNPFVTEQRIVENKNIFLKPSVDKNSSSSQTYPGRGCGNDSCPSVTHHPNSEVKQRSVLTLRNNIALRAAHSAQKPAPDFHQASPKIVSISVKRPTPCSKAMKMSTPVLKTPKSCTSQVSRLKICTPQACGLKSNNGRGSASKSIAPQLKSSTPVMKQGIKRFTPGSNRSARRSQKKTQLQKVGSPAKESVRCLFPDPKPQEPPAQPLPVPETPSNHRGIPSVPAATPSYPQTGQSSKITLKSIVIKGKSYMFIKKLGSGGSSEVFKVLEVGGECGEYAVKCVNMAVDRNLAQGYINEIRLLRELQSSDRVIQLHAYEYDKASQSLKVVLEVGETDLSSFLKARQATGLPPALVLYYWEEMLHAVHHIHEHGVVHADLKPANFLLVCGRLKLIDFGIASAISTDATSVERPCAAGTFSYISPEALMGGAGRYESVGLKDDNAPIKISFRSDVWSLGCILYSMVYGCTPFGHITHFYAKIAAIVNPKHVINYPAAENIPANLTAAMKWCLTYNAKSRPSVRQLLSIEYLAGAAAAGEPLPAALLDRLRPHLTEDEHALLRKATV